MGRKSPSRIDVDHSTTHEVVKAAERAEAVQRLVGIPFALGDREDPRRNQSVQQRHARHLIKHAAVAAAETMIALLGHDDPKIRMQAAQDLLDRGLGRATAPEGSAESNANSALAGLLQRYATPQSPPSRSRVEVLDPE